MIYGDDNRSFKRAIFVTLFGRNVFRDVFFLLMLYSLVIIKQKLVPNNNLKVKMI